MNIADPHNFLRDLCRAIGIDPTADPVHSITITARAGSLAIITVEKHMTASHAPAVLDLVAASDVRPDVTIRRISEG